jgi:Flp pilus assembly pilin Flp
VTTLTVRPNHIETLLVRSSHVHRRRAVWRALTPRREVTPMPKFFDLLERLNRSDSEAGQTMAEYGVVLAVITIAVFGALALLSGHIVTAINRVAGYIS